MEEFQAPGGASRFPERTPAFLTIKFVNFFSFLWIIFDFLGQNRYGSASPNPYTDPIRIHKPYLHTCPHGRPCGCTVPPLRDPNCRAHSPANKQVSTMDKKFRNQCCGSMTFWYGSGSGSAHPCLWLMDPDPDTAVFVFDLQDVNKKLFFLSLLAYYFWRSIYIIFKDKKSKRSHKAVGIKVFLTIFSWW